MRNTNTQVRQTALTAVLAAIVLLMTFTPLGYLYVGPVAITFMVIPVVIGGITLGPARGGFLGGVLAESLGYHCRLLYSPYSHRRGCGTAVPRPAETEQE